jgi:hypothetical protein
VLLKLEGVLVRENRRGTPIQPGLTLLRWIQTDPSREPIMLTDDGIDGRRWLTDELGADEHLKVWGPDIEDPIKHARWMGYDVELYVHHSPLECAAAIRQGVTALLFASPAFQRPEFDPDTRTGLRAWSEIEAEMSRQGEQRERTMEKLDKDADDPFEDS